jgi:hypothetical protein
MLLLDPAYPRLLIETSESAQTPDRSVQRTAEILLAGVATARGRPVTKRARAVQVVMLSATHGGARQLQRRRCRYSPCRTSQVARLPGGSHGTQPNEVCLSDGTASNMRVVSVARSSGWNYDVASAAQRRDQACLNDLRRGVLTERRRVSRRTFHLRRRFSGLLT